MTALDMARESGFYSVFANENERLVSRVNAAKSLGELLSALPESNISGRLKTAMIKCELASKFADTHSQLDHYFCEVSELLQVPH